MKKPGENEKVTESVMTRSVISSVIVIVLCMVCFVGTTWAWYSSSVESGAGETFGANFDFSVEITESVAADENGVYTFVNGTHTVALTKAGTAEKGFCKVVATKSGEASDTTTYYIVDFTAGESVNFRVTGSGKLELIPMLGTPASGYTALPAEIELTPDPVEAEFDVEEEEVEEEEEPEPEDDGPTEQPEEPTEQPTTEPSEQPTTQE